ncbi:hypothetical protein DEU56DRAFT_960441 [Suillus clintonianus]|uniref:uncharacterized protein n=1 Tax=Suillus clintonianus TaxID=1904413 RepID=UPI001B865417|nr:uncharacterized protein DEU56DRAFT_960441 [Suillus clintonianus]KAG2151484.1 hypothetical protein DEU56DRAFT_960441 [Suillus clintonianus]
MIDALKKYLSQEIAAYIGLCYTFTTVSIAAKDEFGIPFSYRSQNFFAVSTSKAEQTKNRSDLDSQEAALRCKLANYSTQYFEDQTRALPCDDEFDFTFGKGTTRRYYVEQQLWEAMRSMKSAVVGKDGSELPLMPIYNQMRAIGLQEFHAHRSIIVVVRRIQLHRVTEEGEGEEYEDEDVLQHELGEPEPPSNITYTLGTARALYFTPNPDTGHFEFVANPTPVEKETPCLYILAWSTYFDDATGSGLNSADHEEYFAALVQSDPWWLVMQYSAGHPPYTGSAKDRTPHHDTGFDQACKHQALSFTYSREHCEGFNLNSHISGEHRPNLCNEYRMASLMAVTRGITSCQEVKMGEPGTSYLRIKRPVDFQIDHLQAMSLSQAIKGCEDLIRFHEKVEAAGAIIGPFVVRMGTGAVSCTDRDHADLMTKTKNVNAVKKYYLEKYPNNEILF